MIDDGIKGGNTDMALADFLVAVFMAGQFVLTVVNVNGLQPIEADDLIEGQEDVVELMDDVVAAVKDVARIEQTPILSFMTALSMMAANSSKVRPTSVPLPAMVSKRTVVF